MAQVEFNPKMPLFGRPENNVLRSKTLFYCLSCPIDVIKNSAPWTRLDWPKGIIFVIEDMGQFIV